jgi:hypothetical protein
VIGDNPTRFGEVNIGYGDAWSDDDRRCPHEPNGLETPHDLSLPVDVRDPAVEGIGVGCFESGRKTRPEAADEGVRMTTASVKLKREVKALFDHTSEERILLDKILDSNLGFANAASGRNDRDPIHRTGPVRQKIRVPRLTE